MAEVKNAQPDLFARIEPRQLPKWGWWTLNTKPSDGGRLQQAAYGLDRIEWVLSNLNPDLDSYMSQGFFSKQNRRAMNLAYLTHGFVDLDIYKIKGFENHTPEQIAWELREFCRNELIPIPSYIVFSGRGLYLKWAWTHPIPKPAAGRAIAVNKALLSRFERFGADKSVFDVSRILRVVGTRNNKSGELCKIVHMEERKDGILTYSFDTFADEILPYTPQEVREFKAQNALVSNLTEERKKRKVASRIFSWEDWHWKIICDLEHLAVSRYGGEVPEGMRDAFGFVGACQLAHTVNGANLWHEIREWSSRILPKDWVSKEFNAHCSSLLSRSRLALNGEKVIWAGRERSPIYTYKKDTLIDMLEITPDEQVNLHALVGRGEKERRRTEKRRAAGVMERSQYEGKATALARKAKELKAEGCSLPDIQRELGVSRATVFRYLKT